MEHTTALELLAEFEARQMAARTAGRYDEIEGIEQAAGAVVDGQPPEQRNELVDAFTWGLVDSIPDLISIAVVVRETASAPSAPSAALGG
jgi:hypothetical protein